jgi:renalase
MELIDVVVVGAGAAGLTAAGRLAGEHGVVVVDKGRGVGGRMATRRIGDATFDHGAQFVTTHHGDFATQVAGWCAAGVAQPWYHGQVGPTGAVSADGHARYRGTVSMNAIAKHLAAGLDVRRSSRVVSILEHDGRWRLELADGARLDARAVVLSAPVPQGLELLAAGGVHLAAADAAVLSSIEYHPCLAAMVPLDGPSRLPEPGAVAPGGGPIDWLADNAVKGISGAPGVTIHAGPTFSHDWWDRSDEDVVAELVAAARESAGLAASALPGVAQVQRWRYARPVEVHPEPCRVLGALPPLVCCGDAFGEAKVEGAVRSGTAAADALLARFAGA